MAYNHGREKTKWDRLKKKEEKLLRELGVSETMIEELHKYDWQIFKKERTYSSWNISSEEISQQPFEYTITSGKCAAAFGRTRESGMISCPFHLG